MIYLLKSNKDYLVYCHEDDFQGFNKEDWSPSPPLVLIFEKADEYLPSDKERWWESQHDEFCDADLICSFNNEQEYNDWAINNPELFI